MNLLYTRVKYANPHKPIGKRELKKRAKFYNQVTVIKHNHGAGFTEQSVQCDQETIKEHL